MNRADSSMDFIHLFPKVYENLSGTYHEARFGGPKGKYDVRETITLLFDLFGDLRLDPRTMQALDVGCGTGKVSLPMAQAGAQVTCLDASPGMLEQCYQRAAESGVADHISLKEASADKIPYNAGTFDFAIASRFLHLFPTSYYPMFINEMLRVVKPNGYVVVEIKNKYFGFFITLYKEGKLARAGLTHSSLMSLPEVYRLQDKLVDGRIEKVVACQLPKAYLLPPNSAAAALVRRLSRTVLSPIAFFFFAVIKKC